MTVPSDSHYDPTVHLSRSDVGEDDVAEDDVAETNCPEDHY